MKIKLKLCLIFGIILMLTLAASSMYGVYKLDKLSVQKNDDLLRTRANLKVKALDERLVTLFSTIQMTAREIAASQEKKVDFPSLLVTLKNLQMQLGAIEAYFALESGVTYDSLVDTGAIDNFNAKELQREWYLDVFKHNNKMFVTKPYMSVTTKKYVISAGVPVIKDNKLIGALCVDIELGEITDYIVKLSNNKNMFVTNEFGTIFASCNSEDIGKNMFEVFPDFKKYAESKDVEFDLNWKYKNYQKYLVVVKSLEILDWKFWQYEPYAAINQDADSFLMESIIFFIIALLISLIVIYMIARYIATPITATADIISKFARTGNTSLKEDNMWVARKDEIGVMAKAFDQMIGVLHEKSITAKEIADGNLEVEVSVLSEEDHLGLAFSQMVRDLNSVLGQVNTAVNEVTTGADQISISANYLSDGATKQAASIEEISASITELNGQTKTNAENAAVANKLASETAIAAKSGQEQMTQLSSAMLQISANAEETQKVIKTIDDIAFQTNLLALNAAVEAARAGTHGKGFAVVAEEVRNLAARSAKAAKETADLIYNSNSQINEGVTISEQTAEALSRIADNIVKTSDTVEEITVASHEQAEGISQIGIGLDQIDSVTQQNTANAEETASASEEMSEQAKTLQRLLEHFKLKNISNKKVFESKSSAKRINRPLGARPKSQPANSDNWGGAENSVDLASVVSPNEQIALDDDEFGKF